MGFVKTHWILSLVVLYSVACYIDANVHSLSMGKLNMLRGVFSSGTATPAARADATAAP